MHRIGEIDLDGLAAVCRLQGQDGLPYPFGHAHAHVQHDEVAAAVADRFDSGDLSALRDWTDAYIAAEIWVVCRVHDSSADTADRRILAHRAGDAGFLASQRSNDDVVEVSTLSALDLGAAVAGSIELTNPGSRPRIVVPGYVGYFAEATGIDDDIDDAQYSVPVAVNRPTAPAHSGVADDDVTAIATIQSRWQPARRWGVDWATNVVACIHIEADGDYVYTPAFSHAVPVTEHSLGERIDRLIAEDITALRLQRGIVC